MSFRSYRKYFYPFLVPNLLNTKDIYNFSVIHGIKARLQLHIKSCKTVYTQFK